MLGPGFRSRGDIGTTRADSSKIRGLLVCASAAGPTSSPGAAQAARGRGETDRTVGCWMLDLIFRGGASGADAPAARIGPGAMAPKVAREATTRGCQRAACAIGVGTGAKPTVVTPGGPSDPNRRPSPGATSGSLGTIGLARTVSRETCRSRGVAVNTRTALTAPRRGARGSVLALPRRIGEWPPACLSKRRRLAPEARWTRSGIALRAGTLGSLGPGDSAAYFPLGRFDLNVCRPIRARFT